MTYGRGECQQQATDSSGTWHDDGSAGGDDTLSDEEGEDDIVKEKPVNMRVLVEVDAMMDFIEKTPFAQSVGLWLRCHMNLPVWQQNGR